MSRAIRLWKRSLVLSVLFFVAYSIAAFAQQQPWDGPAFSADAQSVLKAAAAIKAEKNADVTVLLDERVLKLDDKGRKAFALRFVYRIETAAGASIHFRIARRRIGEHVRRIGTVQTSMHLWRAPRPEFLQNSEYLSAKTSANHRKLNT